MSLDDVEIINETSVYSFYLVKEIEENILDREQQIQPGRNRLGFVKNRKPLAWLQLGQEGSSR